MKKSFIIIGLGEFGSCVAKTLEMMNCDLLAVGHDEEQVSKIAADVPHCLIADSTKLNVLKELGASSVDHAVVCIENNFQASILTIMNLKKLGVKKITVRADDEEHKEVYKMLGASEVIIPEEASAISLANQIVSDTILDYYEVSKDYAMAKSIVGKNFVSRSLIELDVRNRFDINIVGIIKEGEKFSVPRGTDTLSPGDIVVVVGKKAKIGKFDRFLNRS